MKQVTILVPVYTCSLSETEYISLDRCAQVLGPYPRVFVKPRSLDISGLSERYPDFGIEEFDDDWFGSVDTYSRLLMSAGFYRRFSDSEYILIYQTDAYVFRDELKEWCGKGYDYVGAPWMKRSARYMVSYLRYPVRNLYYLNFPALYPRAKVFKVGNGGFSLRKVSRMIRVLEQYALLRDECVVKNTPEDLFFGLELLRHAPGALKVPKYREALHFSMEMNVWASMKLNHWELPFGCHAWSMDLYYRVWSTFYDFRKGELLPDFKPSYRKRI